MITQYPRIVKNSSFDTADVYWSSILFDMSDAHYDRFTRSWTIYLREGETDMPVTFRPGVELEDAARSLLSWRKIPNTH